MTTKLVLIAVFLSTLAFVSSWLQAARASHGIQTRPVGKSLRLKDTTEDIAAEKLIYDTKSGRFFESKVEDICLEEFCLLDEDGKPILLTRDEKERVFLDAIQSYYYSGKSGLPDNEFDRLKEDLSWEGSALVNLSRDEAMFMNAMQAYNKGKPIISDEEFNTLKAKLKETGSKLAVQTEPKCYVDTGVCKVTWQPDSIRTNSLYVPAGLFTALIFVGITYELLNLFDASLNPVLALILGYPIITNISKSVTDTVLFDRPEVLIGPCPKCGVDNKVFFGDVLGVKGDREESTCKCTNCKAGLTIIRSTRRVSTLAGKSKGPQPKEEADAED